MNTTQQLLFDSTLHRLAKGVYTGTIKIKDIAPKPNNDVTPRRDIVDAVVKDLQPGLVDSTSSFALTRALWKIIRPNDTGRLVQYVPKEMEGALFEVACGQMSHADATRKYGVPKQQLAARLNQLHDTFNVPRGMGGRRPMMEVIVATPMAVMLKIRTLSKVRSHTQYTSYLSPDEADLLNRVAYVSTRTGTAMDVNTIALLARNAIHASGRFHMRRAGDNPAAKAQAQRLLDAVISKKFVNRVIVKGSRLSELNKTGMFKASKMAEKRIRALDPFMEKIARIRYLLGANKLIKKKKITRAQFLDPSNHHNMDEVAQSTNNRHTRVALDARDRDYLDACISCAHERSLFTTSLCITSSPGVVHTSISMPLLVIHAAKSEHSFNASVFEGLSPDLMVDTSPSAYNTQDIFYKYVRAYQKKTGAGPGNPKFLWCDNHESHWSGEALAWARKQHVYILFLRSQASSVDQPNDRGVNACFKRHFDNAYTAYCARWPGLAFTRRSLNEVLSTAYATFVADKNLGRIVKKAWEVTGMHPFILPEDVK